MKTKVDPNCKDVPDVNKLDTIAADSQRNKKQWDFNRKSRSKTIDAVDARIVEGQKAESQPPSEQPRRSRRKKNIIVGWLCSKIVKAFVKSKTLL